jgi:hypothetical protein
MDAIDVNVLDFKPVVIIVNDDPSNEETVNNMSDILSNKFGPKCPKYSKSFKTNADMTEIESRCYSRTHQDDYIHTLPLFTFNDITAPFLNTDLLSIIFNRMIQTHIIINSETYARLDPEIIKNSNYIITVSHNTTLLKKK